MPPLIATALQDNFDRFGPLVLLLVATFILVLRWRDRRSGGDSDDQA